MRTFHFLRTVCILLVLSLVGCSTADYRHKRLSVVGQPTNHLSGILVVPLYRQSGGISVGPDGKGLATPPAPVVMKPFIFSSGEDIMTNKVQARGVWLLPLLTYIGSFSGIDRWLLLKKGYSPLVIDEGAIWADRPIEMTPAASDEVTPCIEILLAANPDQDAIKTMMNARSITETVAVRLDASDKALLQNYRSKP
jgi:hypothetical protein